MNKRVLKAGLVCLVAAGCAASACLAGCNKNEGKKSYYGKTVTFTGNDFTYGFDRKGASDNYGDLSGGSLTQRKIAETYWKDIDWASSGFTAAPANADELKTKIENTHPYTSWAGTSFTVNKSETATVTLKLSSAFSSLGWGNEVTMPLYEDRAKLSTDYQDITLSTEPEAGYAGVAVKTDGNKRLVLELSMSYDYANGKDCVFFNLCLQTKNEYDTYDNSLSVGTARMDMELKALPKDNGHGGTVTDTVLSIRYDPEITIADKQ